MIVHESSYTEWLVKQGVGANDQVASSRASYVSYLNSVSRLIGEDISPQTLSSEADLARISARISGQPKGKTLRNYASAMRQYVAMVEAGAHP